jgi:hydrogenase maturation protein HypF
VTVRGLAGGTTAERRRIRVRGIVQGVGFRPFVHRAAGELGLEGSVRNDGQGVTIDVQGGTAQIDALLRRLRCAPPPLARVDAIEAEPLAVQPTLRGFAVLRSEAGPLSTAIGPDAATCEACLRELFDPADRRWRYPFVNCTHCGPRYTIVRRLPYDRATTSMSGFELCDDCSREYRDPLDRRFHAEPNACAACGPRLWLEAAPRVGGAAPGRTAGDAAVAAALRALRAGAIVALKSLGGFHLACDADDPAAVARLRARKRRDAQPLAIMALNLDSVADLVVASPAERALLEGRERPIVLLRRRSSQRPSGVADGLGELGVMLPYTPLHYLLFHDAAARPAGTAWLSRPLPLRLVMTSANPHGEPLVTGDDEARTRLDGIADLWLMHDREIVARCDDSVLQGADPLAPRDPGTFVRRARGHSPAAVALAGDGAATLGLGCEMKATVCLTRGREAFLSPHLGDLDDAATRRGFDAALRHLLELVQVEPQALAHDLHPDVHGTRVAQALALETGVKLLGVQHHHAHAAAVLAEHCIEAPALALALDGTGLGTDGGLWGGERLWVDGARFERSGSLATLPLPGGERAAREPWRCAAGALATVGRGDEIAERFASQPAARAVAAMLRNGTRCPPTSALGRWFDAAAGLLGLREVASYEAQAAMELEALAWAVQPAGPWASGTVGATEGLWSLEDGRLDLAPLILDLARAGSRGVEVRAAAAARFHATLVEALSAWALEGCARHDTGRVVLAGGCLLNRWLRSGLVARLEAAGLQVLVPRQLPPGDGALSLGQAWVARHWLGGR